MRTNINISIATTRQNWKRGTGKEPEADVPWETACICVEHSTHITLRLKHFSVSSVHSYFSDRHTESQTWSITYLGSKVGTISFWG